MFAIGPLEIAVVLIFGLLFIGPKKLPELAKQLGKFFVQMKRVTTDVRHGVDEYMRKAEDEILADERAKVRATLAQALNSDDLNIQKQINDAISEVKADDKTPIDVAATAIDNHDTGDISPQTAKNPTEASAPSWETESPDSPEKK